MYTENCPALRESEIALTNVKGAFSQSLAEFVALGMLYHSKKVEQFMNKKAAILWDKSEVDMVSKKTMLIVGYGDIGAACGKIAKNGFGTRVIGVRRRPEVTTLEEAKCVDEIHGLADLPKLIPQADFIVAILPGTKETNNFFD